MSAREDWRQLLDGEPAEQILVDVGTSTVTGVAAPGAPDLAATVRYVGHPVLQTLALDTADTHALGSHFVRTGLVFEPPAITDDGFTDPLGIGWLWAEGSAAPLVHPLEDAGYLDVARHPRPAQPELLQVPAPAATGEARPLIVADAPTPGLVETCFGLRNAWQFMIDITDNWRVANALLDWALETVAAAYEQMLTAMPVQPDVVLYGDDYGYQGGMFLSEEDFRTFVRPRLRTLFSRIRRCTTAALCFHCCGAVHPILGDLADLGVELINLQYDAKNMQLSAVRAELPRTMVLHGYTNLQALGTALAQGDRRSIALLTDELVRSAPVIAAPVDSLPTEEALLAVARAARFVRALSPDDISQLRKLGPVARVIDRAAQTACDAPSSRPSGLPAQVIPVATQTRRNSAHSHRPGPGRIPKKGKEVDRCPIR